MDYVTVEADYRRMSEGWSTTLTAPQLGRRTLSGADLPTLFDAVVDASVDAAGRLGRACQTVHRVAGDTDALAALAVEKGLSDTPDGPVVTLSVPVALPATRPVPRARCPYAHR